MKYKIVCYMRIDVDEEDEVFYDTREEAGADINFFNDNIYEVEEVEEPIDNKEF